MPAVGFEPAILANEWPQTHALARAAAGIGICLSNIHVFIPRARSQAGFIWATKGREE